MVPEGCELRWRLWKADGEWSSADAAGKPAQKPAQKPTAAEAERAAAAWVERLGERGLVLDETFADAGFVVCYDGLSIGGLATCDRVATRPLAVTDAGPGDAAPSDAAPDDAADDGLDAPSESDQARQEAGEDELGANPQGQPAKRDGGIGLEPQRRGPP
jgi:hypothetical protein